MNVMYNAKLLQGSMFKCPPSHFFLNGDVIRPCDLFVFATISLVEQEIICKVGQDHRSHFINITAKVQVHH